MALTAFDTARVCWKHLRMPFQLTLAPLFLWGCFLAEARLGGDVALGFISLHLCLYPGVTAFNSAYDRDTGPVMGMLEPPQVPAALLPFSILLQVIGAALAAVVGLGFLAVYGLIAVLAAGYSHPAVRWKADPVRSTIVVGFGQGALGCLAGWYASAGSLGDGLNATLFAGLLSAALTTVGLYPATQVFQVEEDSARGDRTLAVALGPCRALRFGSLCLVAGGTVAAALVARRAGAADAVLLGTVYLVVVLHNEVVAKRVVEPNRVVDIYVLARRTGAMATAGFLLFIVAQMVRAAGT